MALLTKVLKLMHFIGCQPRCNVEWCNWKKWLQHTATAVATEIVKVMFFVDEKVLLGSAHQSPDKWGYGQLVTLSQYIHWEEILIFEICQCH